MIFKSNEQLEAEDRERYQADQDPEGQLHQQEYVIGLVAYIQNAWEAAKRAKQPIETIMLRNLRMKAGEYEPSKLAAIKEQGGSEAFMMLTEEKLSAFESWVEEILFPADDKPWGIKATPRPEMSPQIAQKIKAQIFQDFAQQVIQSGQVPTQEILMARADELMEEFEAEVIDRAREAAEKTEVYLDDILTESGWRKALRASIADVGLYPAGFLKGPLRRKRKKLSWGQGGQPQVLLTEVWEFESPSPWDIYPGPSSQDIGDGYLIERMVFRRTDLQELIGIPGYDKDEIEAVLSAASSGGMNLHNWLGLYNQTERATLENREYEDEDPEGLIDGLQFWGHIQGLKLIEYGYPGTEIKPFEEYFCEVIMIHNWVIKVEINGDPLGRPPYFKASFREKKGSFWKTALPDTMIDCQDACNASTRNLFNNMAIASGPQVGVDIGKFAAGEKITKLRPWRLWQFDLEHQPQSRDPIWFFQPRPLINELLAVYDKYSSEADNKTGVPRYSYGGETKGGALNTASGMSMMMANAARSIKKVVSNIDEGLIEPSVSRTFEWTMLYRPIRCMLDGDIKVVAKGSSALISKEMRQVRRNEAMQTVMTPIVQGIIGNRGVAIVLKEWLKGLDFDAEDIVPSEADLTQIEILQGQVQQLLAFIQGGGPGQPGQGGSGRPGPNEKPRQLGMDGMAPAGGVDARVMGG